jgi:hypothetical protein
MSNHSPYPLLRPYWKGHSREEDKKLAKELLYGSSTINKKTGRCQSYYPVAGGPHEYRAFEALRRLLCFSCRDLEPEILAGLVCALDSRGSFERRLVFQFRKKGNRHDFAADLEIAMYVEGLIRVGQKKPIEHAMANFNLSRKTVFAAIRRFKNRASWLKR